MGMEQHQLAKIDSAVLGWLDEARENVYINLQSALMVSEKDNRKDLVTNVDKSNEQYFMRKIHALDPDAHILGEEGFGDAVKNMHGHVWFVDPIDGTLNFVKQRDDFAMMLALYVDGVPTLGWIMDVDKNLTYHGGPEMGVFRNNEKLIIPENLPLSEGLIELSGNRLVHHQFKFEELAEASLGVRVIGSAGMSFIKVLEGKAVAYASKMKPWDFAAAKVLLESLKMPITTIDGKEIDMLSSNTVLGATNAAHSDIVRIELA